MAALVKHRVQKRREALRARGLRPVQIWVPDVTRPGFADEYRRQVHRVAEADSKDAEIDLFLEETLSDILEDLR